MRTPTSQHSDRTRWSSGWTGGSYRRLCSAAPSQLMVWLVRLQTTLLPTDQTRVHHSHFSHLVVCTFIFIHWHCSIYIVLDHSIQKCLTSYCLFLFIVYDIWEVTSSFCLRDYKWMPRIDPWWRQWWRSPWSWQDKNCCSSSHTWIEVNFWSNKRQK